MVHLETAIAEFYQKMRLECEDFDNAFIQAEQKLVLQFRISFLRGRFEQFGIIINFVILKFIESFKVSGQRCTSLSASADG